MWKLRGVGGREEARDESSNLKSSWNTENVLDHLATTDIGKEKPYSYFQNHSSAIASLTATVEFVSLDNREPSR